MSGTYYVPDLRDVSWDYLTDLPPHRLETRAAAEEIVERLHGRVIRLDDSGTRISVRFADTTEQRELRVSNPFSSQCHGRPLYADLPSDKCPFSFAHVLALR